MAQSSISNALLRGAGRLNRDFVRLLPRGELDVELVVLFLDFAVRLQGEQGLALPEVGQGLLPVHYSREFPLFCMLVVIYRNGVRLQPLLELGVLQLFAQIV